MADGHLGKCKSCTKKDVKERYYKHFEVIQEYEKKRFNDDKRKAKVSEYQIKRRLNFPGKNRIRVKTLNAIRDDKLIKKPCEKCGTKNKIEAHHNDYRKAFDITWLCFTCHRALHKELKK